jgi:hypothetical protein
MTFKNTKLEKPSVIVNKDISITRVSCLTWHIIIIYLHKEVSEPCEIAMILEIAKLKNLLSFYSFEHQNGKK